VYSIPIHKATHLFTFKYRETCSVDLIVHLKEERDDYLIYKYWNFRFENNEYMDDKYMVIVRLATGFQDKTHPWLWSLRPLADHRIFTWTLVRSDLNRLSFRDIYFIAKTCDEGGNCTLHISPALELVNTYTSKIRVEMDTLAASIRKILFWIPKPTVNYAKLDRVYKLPYDERNLNRKPSWLFHYFIEDLINRSNNTPKMDIYFTAFGSYREIYELDTTSFVPDETDDFNFITCATSDTFWSIIELFTRPYQAPVWACLGLTFLTTTVV